MRVDAVQASSHGQAAPSDICSAAVSSKAPTRRTCGLSAAVVLTCLALMSMTGCVHTTDTTVNLAFVEPAARWLVNGSGRSVAPAAQGAHVPGTADRFGPRPRRFGTSVLGRPLRAYRVGDRRSDVTAVLLGNMHGDEPAGVRLVNAVRRAPRLRGVDLWVVPTMNPDGLAADTRQNAHGVDLNRNWPHRWRPQTGPYDSGPRPFSEPETRAMRRFLNRVDPRFVVSFHQPLHGVDSDAAKNRHLLNRLARNLRLPKKPLRCSGVCHGTMTGWYNAHHSGSAITVELGPQPSAGYLTGRGARGTVRSVLGRF
jgi:murein peptide amidase A